MIPLTTITGLTASALVAVAISIQLLNIARFPVAARVGVIALLSLAMVIPVNGVLIAGYVWGLIGDPSIATIALMSLVVIKQVTRRDVSDDRNVSALLFLVLVGSGVLYPLALGLSPYDPYALGFGSWIMYFGLFGLAIVAWLKQLHLVVCWIIASVLSYTFGLFESTNLWNYLLDPIVAVIAIGWAVMKLIERLRKPNLGHERAIA